MSPRRRIGLTLGAATLALISVQAIAQAPDVASKPRDEAASPQPLLDVGELMDLFLKPTYAELQRAMAQPPVDRKGWAAIYSAAIRLAEIDNLLFFREKSGYPGGREWPALARRARQVSADVAAAALAALRNPRPEDFDDVRQKYAAISASCNACHRGLNTLNGPTVKP